MKNISRRTLPAALLTAVLTTATLPAAQPSQCHWAAVLTRPPPAPFPSPRLPLPQAAAAAGGLMALDASEFAHALATAATFAAGLQQAFRMDSM